MSASKELALPERPARGVIVCRAMFLLQKAYPRLHRDGGTLVRAGHEGDRLRVDGVKGRDFRATENGPDECTRAGFPERRRPMVY